MDQSTMIKRAQSFGYMNFNSQDSFEVKYENSNSQFSFSHSKRLKEEHDQEDEEEEEIRKYANPRKQTAQIGNFNSFQSTNLLNDILKNKKKEGTSTPLSASVKKEEADSQQRSNTKEKRISQINLKTPTIVKQEYEEYTPSPNKPLYEGRTRRNVRPFSRLNPDEYEMSK